MESPRGPRGRRCPPTARPPRGRAPPERTVRRAPVRRDPRGVGLAAHGRDPGRAPRTPRRRPGGDPTVGRRSASGRPRIPGAAHSRRRAFPMSRTPDAVDGEDRLASHQPPVSTRSYSGCVAPRPDPVHGFHSFEIREMPTRHPHRSARPITVDHDEPGGTIVDSHTGLPSRPSRQTKSMVIIVPTVVDRRPFDLTPRRSGRWGEEHGGR